MPSSTTSNYNLSQWEADDKVLRADFNADNAKIDAALKSEVNARTALAGQVAKKAEQSALNSEVNTRTSQVNTINNTLAKKGNCTIYHTSYAGDGELTKTLTFPKKPLAVFIMGNVGSVSRYITGSPYMISSAPATYGTISEVTWSGTSMTWTIRQDQSKDFAGNSKNWTYQVIALIDAST